MQSFEPPRNVQNHADLQLWVSLTVQVEPAHIDECLSNTWTLLIMGMDLHFTEYYTSCPQRVYISSNYFEYASLCTYLVGRGQTKLQESFNIQHYCSMRIMLLGLYNINVAFIPQCPPTPHAIPLGKGCGTQQPL